MRQTINKGRVAYEPNSLGGGCPFQAMMTDGGFHSYEERVDARKVRARSESFRDHFTQPALFYHSQSEAEKKHIVDAFSFELGKVETVAIRQRMVNILTQIDTDLANKVAANLGLTPQEPQQPINHSFGADTDPESVQPTEKKNYLDRSEALSMANTVKDTIKTRRVAFLATNGVDDDALDAMKLSLMAEGAMVKIVAPKHGSIKTVNGAEVKVDETWLTTSSVLFDAVYVPGGKASVDALSEEMEAIHFVNEAFKHCKAVAATGEGVEFVKNETFAGRDETDKAVILGGTAKETAKPFINAIAQHRNWERETARKVPA